MSGAHDLVPFPAHGKFAEVRMVYCRRCGATQPVEPGDRPPLSACGTPFVATLAVPRLARALIEAELFEDVKRDGFGLAAEIIAEEYARLDGLAA